MKTNCIQRFFVRGVLKVGRNWTHTEQAQQGDHLLIYKPDASPTTNNNKKTVNISLQNYSDGLWYDVFAVIF